MPPVHLAVAVAVAAAACGATAGPPAGPRAACAPPPGLDTTALTERQRGLVARRLLVCEDLVNGRIDAPAYHGEVAAIDEALVGPPVVRRPPRDLEPTPDGVDPIDPDDPSIVWATDVRGVSSEYSADGWSASRALGPPDTYPTYGDTPTAWASRDADGADEWIEVGFDLPVQTNGVEIVETYNPGAVDRVDLIDVHGASAVAWVGNATAAPAVARRNRIDVRCTRDKIAAVRVHLASAAVPGWNELDAIGLARCAAP